VLVQAGQPFEDSERASSGCWSVVGDTDNRVGALDNHLKLERLVGVPLCFVTQVARQARHVAARSSGSKCAPIRDWDRRMKCTRSLDLLEQSVSR
jgi:hypothetical protein